MKTLLILILVGFSTTVIFSQEKNLFKQDSVKNLFSPKQKTLSLSQSASLPELSFKNKDALNYVKFHSKIIVFQPKETGPIVIYPFDPKVQGALRVFHPN
jgi:hypothetical protein